MQLDLYPVMNQEYIIREEKEGLYIEENINNYSRIFFWDRLRLPVSIPWPWFI